VTVAERLSELVNHGGTVGTHRATASREFGTRFANQEKVLEGNDVKQKEGKDWFTKVADA
jgi:hypothetical protein